MNWCAIAVKIISPTLTAGLPSARCFWHSSQLRICVTHLWIRTCNKTNCARKTCVFLCTILFVVTWTFCKKCLTSFMLSPLFQHRHFVIFGSLNKNQAIRKWLSKPHLSKDTIKINYRGLLWMTIKIDNTMWGKPTKI